jgi:hypothetical protein
MEMSSPVTFKRRQNRDGSWDSICTKCFLTVRSTLREDELTEHEQSHNCEQLLAQKTSMPN